MALDDKACIAMKCSIISVCRNEKNRIKLTLDSIRTQTFKDFEHIVIDGGSTDGTVDEIHRCAEKIAYWCSEPDNGIYEAMNKGIRHANGDYLLFLNGGDELAAPDVLEKVFASQYDEDILYGDMIKDDAGHRYLSSLNGYSSTPFFFFAHTLPHQGSFIKKKLFDDFGPYDESYRLMGDYEFFKRALIQHKATMRYLGLIIGVFDYSGMSTKPEFKPIQRSEVRKARLSTYGLSRFILFSFIYGIYDLLIYRPRRKLKKILGKS